ncbi:dihydrodipicolinate synthase [Syntrophotalea carbinolica DSM 2380]|uniref:4-hydroxy-tetrahydrodipicolinate synthase n=1 Tax=Syntrophotalea carbinolica (strain DSM 2380 / NBRC 103641 / GraBd1) TaxID=338963 RepID=DAPA_SYNC1|nr:4-hydroxy-tetrahydrodipicolinate synthase [Syntrophotalea carbinolica]Q3A1U7.1 RecName: Full=4-hydroxy-tetrahydrodipicolinate synthase; Short=HTPA synthase [Syntrophotalea carbinolica DSM 2380]ABA89660.1 dihydrodipicolinate synthase [Syntrophotalea carbinolica DSM 2380]
MFTGSMVAIITPFDREGRFDEETFRKLIDFQIENGTDVIVPCGTTGESATLDHAEHKKVIKTCIEQVNKRVPVLAGTGSNATSEAIELTRDAKKMGADGALLISPYYNKPSQEGVYRHFKAIADNVALPQVLYNVPGRTGMNMTAATTIRLASHPNVVGIKEASGDLTQASTIIAEAGDQINVISGDDFLTLPMMACGGKGVISVTANILPGEVKAMVTAVNENRYADAKKIHLNLLNLHQAMFIETNPVPVKVAAALMGLCGDHLRLPLVELLPENLASLKKVLSGYGLIQA